MVCRIVCIKRIIQRELIEMFEKVTVEEFIDEVSVKEIMEEFESQYIRELEMWLDTITESDLDFELSFDF